MRTIGNGCIRTAGALVTMIASVATPESPLASVTRSRTTWPPGVTNDVLSTGPTAVNGPLPRGSQAEATIGLETPAEFDASEMVWPTYGFAGTHVNDATGGAGPVTVKVLAGLTPTLPAWSDCSARTL